VSGPAFRQAERRIVDAHDAQAVRLDLRIPGLTKIPPSIKNLSNLCELDASNTLVENLTPLASLTSLLLLNLSETQVSSITPIVGLTFLESLDLSETHVSDLTPIAGFTSLKSLRLFGTPVQDIAPLIDLKALQSLFLYRTKVSDFAPLAGLTALQSLVLKFARISDLAPLAGLASLELLDLTGTQVSDLAPLTRLTALRSLDLRGTPVSDIAPLIGLTGLQSLDLRNTQISDLHPLARLTALIDGVMKERPSDGISFSVGPLEDVQLRAFAELDNPERTIKTISYLREQRGLPPYHPQERSSDKEGDETTPNAELPKPLEDVPSPFDFKATEKKTVTVAASDTNIPAFPFSASREDHARRLEAARVAAEDLIEALKSGRYSNVRPEYLSYLERYARRLPQTAEDGNMLLADTMARSLRELFKADAEVLPSGFAAELRACLQQHIALCTYYPEIGKFNRDVRDGKQSMPFPQKAVERFAEVVHRFTPEKFEPPVEQALTDARSSSPPPPRPVEDAPPPSPQTIQPPPNPEGETDPDTTRELVVAATAGRLWKVVYGIALAGEAYAGWHGIAELLGPSAREILEWLASFLSSIPPPG
jgi:Leucine Rich repeats (2 copies)